MTMKLALLGSFVVGIGAAHPLVAADLPATTAPAEEIISKQAISAITYRPQPDAATAASVSSPASPVLAAASDMEEAAAQPATALPAYLVKEREKQTMKNLDHSLAVHKWLETPSFKSTQTPSGTVLSWFQEPKKGSHGKAEIPVFDLDF